MNILIQRLRNGTNATQGALYIDGKFYCGTLEDVRRPVKIPKETRIPAGTYTICLANWGDMNTRYAKKFGPIHKGMLLLNNVPGFEGILLHMGLDKSHTEGCILLGGQTDWMAETQLKSDEAYLLVYSEVIKHLVAKGLVKVTVRDEQFLFQEAK